MTRRRKRSGPMREELLLAVALLCSLLGMGCFSLTLRPHWSAVREGSPSTTPMRERLRAMGTSSLAASLAACMAANHLSMAFLVWVMSVSAAALSVAMLLAYAPRTLFWITLVTSRSVEGERQPARDE
jgi:hypothetical protein